MYGINNTMLDDRSAQKSLEKYVAARIREIRMEPHRGVQRIWRCDSERDFLYGYYVGKIEEGALRYLLKATRAQAGPADEFDIRGVIESHRDDILAAIDEIIK